MSLLKDTILASVGLFEVTRTKAEKIIDDLIARGDLSRSDRKQAILELLEKGDQSTAQFRKRVMKDFSEFRESASQFARDLDWARQTSLEALEARVAELETKVADLQAKSKKKARPKRPARKKSA